MIRYTVIPAEPKAHRLTVRCEVDAPQENQCFRLPTWIPGSYLIREFARHVVDAEASQLGLPIPIEKIDKHTWQCRNQPGQLLVFSWRVHAWDLSVRGAHFDQRHAFFNGSAVFPEAIGFSQTPCSVTIESPPTSNPAEPTPAWTVFTGLGDTTAPPSCPAFFQAPSYADLIDHPFEMGAADQYTVVEFGACQVPHRMVIRGAQDFNSSRLRSDLEKICTAIIALFGTPAPFNCYDFLTTVTGDGYGGLEHRNSTALLASRDELPANHLSDDQPADEAYTRFLGLCSHEYFHAWNVKRISDANLSASKLDQEAYTHLLWFFEGFTSYYDDLMLLRAGVIDQAAYLKLLEKTVQLVDSAPGQQRQSVAESSFDAWIKYYRPDDNTPNSVVSYYAKGSLIALALDLTLRLHKKSLDMWMQQLWRDFGLKGRGLDTESLLTHLSAFAGQTIANSVHAWTHQRGTLPLAELLGTVGISMGGSPMSALLQWGMKVTPEQGLARITHVLDESFAQQAGLAPGDLLVALNGLRLTHANLELQLNRLAKDQALEIHLFREDQLYTFQWVMHASPARTKPALAFDTAPASDALHRRSAWLSQGNTPLTPKN